MIIANNTTFSDTELNSWLNQEYTYGVSGFPIKEISIAYYIQGKVNKVTVMIGNLRGYLKDLCL